MSAFFVTATGTDIGKTFVCAGLIRHWRAKGLMAQAFKPLVSGIDDADPAGSDPAALLAAMGQDVTPAALDAISPWRFRASLAPNMAAALEGKAVDYAGLLTACRTRVAAASPTAPLLVEGVGGAMAPVDDDRTVLDWLRALELPVLLVAGSYLGSISHTLTALTVLADRGQSVAGLVVSETAGATVALGAVKQAVARHFPGIPCFNLPRQPAGALVSPMLGQLADQLLPAR
ncbi:dethiobiotin synthase [Niveispirillum sp. SYP-B3756]|uniref:dethiobiotin synthase n=1 Tax=Niveispirillum sp. SYP-B3756 TaxID=2662178 RepID=UPI0012918E8E|nr:dethiobiotin synthase [Niveispirillum sp. SYP-B3756]MQP67195.1 dethiobiotin synthase [Niveispirillum sp. SYP-B3756]